MWIFRFFPGVCPTEPSNLVFSPKCLVSNGRRALLGGIRLGGSATDDLLEMPCSSHIGACSTSLSCETNLLKVNNELKNEVKKLSNKLERSYNSKAHVEDSKKLW